jgi:hypothetical protein
MIMSSGHTGAGFVVGGLVGDAMNRAEHVNAARATAASLQIANAELNRKITELHEAARNMFGSQIRLKADYEGMRYLIRELLGAIKDLDRENPLLLAKNRDAIAGEASRLADEKHEDSMFSPQLSRRAGMMAVIDACTKEIAKLSPQHKLLSGDERFSLYWVAYQEFVDSRVTTPNQILLWASDRKNTDRGLNLDNTEYFSQVAVAWERHDKMVADSKAKSGPKPT